MRCFTVSRTCSGVCSRSRMRRRAFWRAPGGDATTFHHFYRACTGCQWSNKLAIIVFSRCAAKPHRTSRMTASLSLTPDGAVFNRLTPMPSLCHEPTLGSETGVFRWRVRKYETVSLPTTLRQPDVELGQFKRLLKTCFAMLQGTSDFLFLMRWV